VHPSERRRQTVAVNAVYLRNSVPLIPNDKLHSCYRFCYFSFLPHSSLETTRWIHKKEQERKKEGRNTHKLQNSTQEEEQQQPTNQLTKQPRKEQKGLRNQHTHLLGR
jgi:Zn-finger protein